MRHAWYLCYERIRKEEKNRLFTMFSRHRRVPSQCKKFILLGGALRNGGKNGTEKKNDFKRTHAKHPAIAWYINWQLTNHKFLWDTGLLSAFWVARQLARPRQSKFTFVLQNKGNSDNRLFGVRKRFLQNLGKMSGFREAEICYTGTLASETSQYTELGFNRNFCSEELDQNITQYGIVVFVPKFLRL